MKPVVGDLDEREIESLLRAELVARIAYIDRRGFPYIVPITYAYDGAAFYGFSADGAKLEGMRYEPRVCVAVDRVHDAADWWSVVALGRFEELQGGAALDAVRRISERLTTMADADALPEDARRTYVDRLGAPGVAYRIRVESKHGRFARSGAGRN
jgi:nitroimidazol reductase NimA-like FMN-containing flavoprotein (pyridoxamine 5'-phosphate oxidase superfamily)